MVNHQVARNQRVHFLWIAAETLHRIAHGSKVHHAWNAGEILQHHAAGHERDFFFGDLRGVIVADLLHVFFGDDAAVAIAQARFEQHADGIRQAFNRPERLECIEAVVGAVAGSGLQRSARIEGIVGGHRPAILGSGGQVLNAVIAS